jgi:solute carrier family 25 carnitine/acylcarnitine transporter 20/29
MDVIKSKWQVAPVGTYQTPVHLVRNLIRSEGPSALFRGLAPALLRAFPANAACFAGVETARGLLQIES